MTSVEVRQQLVDTLRLDLIGPDAIEKLGTPNEVLPQSPSRWYLTGFLVPLDAGEEQRAEVGSNDPLDEMVEAGGAGRCQPTGTGRGAAGLHAVVDRHEHPGQLRYAATDGDGALG